MRDLLRIYSDVGFRAPGFRIKGLGFMTGFRTGLRTSDTWDTLGFRDQGLGLMV
jgi:hypothetical protein